MLGKLMKHEWNAVMKVMLPADAVLIAITILGRIMISARVFEMDGVFVQILSGLSMTIYVLCLLAVGMCCTIFLGWRFYKTVYTDEGYLLHTLPVTAHEIVLSKTLVGVCWSLITSILLFASVLILVLGVVPATEFTIAMRELSHYIDVYIGSRFTAWVIFFIFMLIVSSLYSVLWLFAGISFGQFLPKHKVLGAFIGFGISFFVMQIATTITMACCGLFNQALEVSDGSIEGVISYMESDLLSFGLSVVFVTLFYFFTHYMMNKKLNLD